jgi:hypothetical protein
MEELQRSLKPVLHVIRPEVLGRQENLLECLVENLRRDYRAEIYEN